MLMMMTRIILNALILFQNLHCCSRINFSLIKLSISTSYGSELKEGSAIFDENGSNMASNIKNEGGCCSSANPNVYQRLPESS